MTLSLLSNLFMAFVAVDQCHLWEQTCCICHSRQVSVGSGCHGCCLLAIWLCLSPFELFQIDLFIRLVLWSDLCSSKYKSILVLDFFILYLLLFLFWHSCPISSSFFTVCLTYIFLLEYMSYVRRLSLCRVIFCFSLVAGWRSQLSWLMF